MRSLDIKSKCRNLDKVESGRNSGVECQLPKLEVAGSNPVARSIFFVFALILILSSCGYRLVGTAPSSKVCLVGKKVYVAPFKNRTGEPNIEGYMTSEVVSSLQRTGKIEVADEAHAEYFIKGEIVGYTKTVVALDASGDVSTYRLTVTVNVSVRDAKGKEVLKLDGLSHYEDFRVYDEIERTKAEERRAFRDIVSDIAQEIAAQLL